MQSSAAQIKQRTNWLVLVRLVMITVLTVATFVVQRGEEALTLPLIILWQVIVSSYLVSLFYFFIKQYFDVKYMRWLAVSQIIWDVLISTALVYVTGGFKSFFTPLYTVNIVMAAVVLGTRTSYLIASICTIFFGILLNLEVNNIIPHLLEFSQHSTQPAAREVFGSIFLNMALFHLVAYGVGYLTERLQIAERNVEELEDLNQSILDSIVTAVITIDSHGSITSFNQSAEKAFSRREESVLGLDLAELLPELKNSFEHLQRNSTVNRMPDRALKIETSYFDQHRGQLVLLDVLVSPMRGDGYVIALQDITSIRSMEEQVKQNDRLAAVGKLAAGIAHEIRNPLASISGSIEMLSAESQLDANRKLMEIVIKETQRLNDLIGNFLLFAKPPKANVSNVDINRLINETLLLFRNHFQSAVINFDSSDEYIVAVDESQLRQVLWNLLINAVEASPDTPQIWLQIKRAEQEGQVELAIRDEGVGIGEDILGKIFDPFFTTKSSGTGLGLPMTAKILAGFGGSVRVVQPQNGTGVAFVITLNKIDADQEAVKYA